MMQTGTRSMWVLGILLAFATAAGAQTVNGAITGVVKDSSGGVVNDVALTLRNVATDQTVGDDRLGRGGRVRVPQPARRPSTRSRRSRTDSSRSRTPTSRSRSARCSASRSRCRSGRRRQTIEVDRRLLGPERHGDAGARHLARKRCISCRC